MGNERITDERLVASIRPGETLQSQVLARLGDPNDRHAIRLSGYRHESWIYRYHRSRINPAEYLLGVGLYVSGIGLPDHDETLAVLFDPDGVVASIVHTRSSYQTSSFAPDLVIETMTQGTLWVGRIVHFSGSLRWPAESP